jgi:hypothetical protein
MAIDYLSNRFAERVKCSGSPVCLRTYDRLVNTESGNCFVFSAAV